MDKKLALDILKTLVDDTGGVIADAVLALHPELVESEDEKIRKDLIESVKIGKHTGITFTDSAAEKFITWLEKQKEHKSTEYPICKVTEDKSHINWSYLEECPKKDEYEVVEKGDATGLRRKNPVESNPDTANFDEGFKTGREVGFREGVESVKPVEWSEEDEIRRDSSMLYLSNARDCIEFNQYIGNNARESGKQEIQKDIDWLKSLRLQSKEELEKKLRDEYNKGKEDGEREGYTKGYDKGYKDAYEPKSYHFPDVLTTPSVFCDGTHCTNPQRDCINCPIKFTGEIFDTASSTNGFDYARHTLATTFMEYLDKNRPDGKMCLSNGECIDIVKAFKENDWAKIIRYVGKYSSSWKPSEEQMTDLFIAAREGCEIGSPTSNTLKSLYKDLEKL